MNTVCAAPHCAKPGKYLMSWQNKNGRHFGLVCGWHDRWLGRQNLVALAGMPPDEAELFDAYLRETVSLDEYPDWPEWLQHHNEVRHG